MDSTAPEAAPKLTSVPRRASERIDPSMVARPTES